MAATRTPPTRMKDSSTALACDGKTIEWSRAEKSHGVQAPTSSGSFGPTPLEADFADPADFQKAADSYARKASARLPDSATLAIATNHLLFRTARLPATDPDEIAAMALTQMEKDAPLPMEEMVCSHEVLASDEASSLVLAACAPTVTVEQAAALVGLKPERIERVDVRILGILPLLAHAGAISNKRREIILAEEGTSVTLVITESGLPLLIRSLGPITTVFGSALLQTIKISLIQTEIDHGPSEVTQLIALSDTNDSSQAASAVAEQLGCPFKAVSPRALPPVSFGNALRSLSGNNMNLFPDAWKTMLRENQFRRTFRTGLLAGAALWLLLVGWLYAWPAFVDQRIKSLNTEVARLAPAESKVNDVRNRIKIIETYSDRTFSPMEALLEVAINQPQGIDLSAYRYNGTKKQALIEGRSRVPTLVYDFMDQLKTSQLFGEVKLTSGPTFNRSLGVNVFELNIDFKTPTVEERNTP